jgi:hypothetical protein
MLEGMLCLQVRKVSLAYYYYPQPGKDCVTTLGVQVVKAQEVLVEGLDVGFL